MGGPALTHSVPSVVPPALPPAVQNAPNHPIRSNRQGCEELLRDPKYAGLQRVVAADYETADETLQRAVTYGGVSSEPLTRSGLGACMHNPIRHFTALFKRLAFEASQRPCFGGGGGGGVKGQARAPAAACKPAALNTVAAAGAAGPAGGAALQTAAAAAAVPPHGSAAAAAAVGGLALPSFLRWAFAGVRGSPRKPHKPYAPAHPSPVAPAVAHLPVLLAAAWSACPWPARRTRASSRALRGWAFRGPRERPSSGQRSSFLMQSAPVVLRLSTSSLLH
jgi:hypothetical protein